MSTPYACDVKDKSPATRKKMGKKEPLWHTVFGIKKEWEVSKAVTAQDTIY